jgi:hypothetical protein
MLRRAFHSSVPNALSAIALLFVLSGACAQAVVDDDATRDSSGGAVSAPITGGAPTQPATGGNGATIGAPTGGTVTATGGKSGASSGGNQSSTGGKASSSPFGGGGNQTGGASTGGATSKASGGTSSSATGGTSSKASGGMISEDGGSADTGGRASGTGGRAATTGGAGSGSGGECDFSSAACEELSCKSACPTNMGTYCAEACEEVIACLEEQSSCVTLAACVERKNGVAAPCTAAWEMAGGGSMTPGSPAVVATDFYDCACGAAADDTSSGSGGEAGG